MTTVIVHSDFEPKKIKCATVSTFSSSIYHEVMELDAMLLAFWMLSFKPAFSVSSFTFTKRLFSSSLLSAIRVLLSAYLRYWYWYWYFSKQSWVQLVIHPAWHFTWCTLHRNWISRVKMCSLGVHFSQFWTSPLFHIWF